MNQNFIIYPQLIALPIIITPIQTPDEKGTMVIVQTEHELSSNHTLLLDLNEEDLQKAGYQNKKKAWTEEEDRILLKSR